MSSNKSFVDIIRLFGYIPVVSMENEWHMTWGPVYLVSKLEFF